MKKAAFVTLASFAVAMAIGQAPPKKADPTSLPCPVMSSHKVNIAKATKEGLFADHKGRRYFFCCAGCKPAFKKNPDKFKAAKSIATPKKA